ncbi:energy transducer TonB [Stenotrophomonas hibiscicola]|uniref:energy transducer TonB n=1 Tax=Stenotrophomonas hibiscicola TaxID=86189 RepID=UPI0015DDA1CE|nr:energy transducer TonB [[Pseudomonas] hibiscicola]MBA0327873.1 energy transducer TonB [Stenotrophomonas maltophilia]
MAVTTHEDLHSPRLQRDSSVQHKNASPWMWIALIVAMFAAALLWLRHSSQEEVAPAPIGERMLPAPEQAAVTDAATPAARQATPATASRKAAPVVRNREARPLASNRMPTYPAAALRSGVQGSVIASLNVDTRGNVANAAIVSRSGERSRDLDRAVLSTVQNWKFQPAVQDGRAVASVVRVPVDFRTEQR